MPNEESLAMFYGLEYMFVKGGDTVVVTKVANREEIALQEPSKM